MKNGKRLVTGHNVWPYRITGRAMDNLGLFAFRNQVPHFHCSSVHPLSVRAIQAVALSISLPCLGYAPVELLPVVGHNKEPRL